MHSKVVRNFFVISCNTFRFTTGLKNDLHLWNCSSTIDWAQHIASSNIWLYFVYSVNFHSRQINLILDFRCNTFGISYSMAIKITLIAS